MKKKDETNNKKGKEKKNEDDDKEGKEKQQKKPIKYEKKNI